MGFADFCARKSFFIVIILTEILIKCNGNDILGCGGFVKSHVNLDFSKIEIGLYTKEGSLKERTECAPTNGYYFLPLYEKGEYVLKVHPPPGWSFEPSQVDLLVDGSTDHCSTGQDVNFSFNGFGITGRVITAGQKQGPSGISVQLVDDKGEKRNTVTAVGGDFHFTPVIPGKYTVKASHPRWKLDPAQAVVQVKEGNTALPTGVLAVKGYDVKGSVVAYGMPIGGVYVLLYSKEDNQKFRIEGCKTALLQGIPDAPICYSITDPSGEFSFGIVPAGDYRLVVLAKPPGQATITYNVKPEKVEFSVAHDSLFIKNAFEVTGFTVVGQVLSHAGGAGVAGARVLLDGRGAGQTDAAGKFTLRALQPALYTLSFQHEQCELEEVPLSVTPLGPAAPPVARAARWRVCGAVRTPARARRVLLTAQRGEQRVAVSVPDDQAGEWCSFLPPGVYSAAVEVSQQEQRDGLQFYPLTQTVTVSHGPVEGVTFSQLKATVWGRVVCPPEARCEGLPVTLRPLSPEGRYVGRPQHTSVKNGEYTFTEVLPGSVEVSVPADRLCWAEGSHNVPVAREHAHVPPVEHAGYVLRVQARHALEVEYTCGNSTGVLSVPAGVSQQCVQLAGRYALRPRGCHLFEPPQLVADVGADPPATVHLVPVSHGVVIKIFAPEEAKDDVLLKVSSNDDLRVLGPLQAAPNPDGGVVYEHTLYMAEGAVSAVWPTSLSFLFLPSEPQQLVGLSECQPEALAFRAARALTLHGRIVPPVADVTVTLTADDVKQSVVTGPDGRYRFGPLDASKLYAVSAEKDSYVFGARADGGDIAAHKLAEISVRLEDAAGGAPLQNALVSVSGGTYRRNAASGADGRLAFGSLAPGEYYVKPNMKEFRFAPPHHLLAVREGRTHHVTLKGERVAWSCVGALLSLGGAGWPGAGVLAVPAPGGKCAVEEATTEANGAFRIRGLLPKCVYTLQLKESSAPELAGLRLAKAPPAIEVIDNKDIENVRLIGVQPHHVTDAAVLVYTPDVQHYRHLRLSLAAEAAPRQALWSAKLDPAGYSATLNPGLMFVLPRLPADNRTYVLQLESALSRTTHAYDDEVHYFTSDGKFKHFTIEFVPKVKSSEQELRQTSLLVIPLAALLLVAYLQRAQLAAALLGLLPARAAPRRAPRAELLDKASIDHIVSTVNAAGKKGKKKVQ